MLVWYQQVDNAKTGLEVVAIARDYLASWGPHEISFLPDAIRPGRMRDEQDIELLHARVIDAYHGTKATGDELDALQRMTSFVVRAAIRIAELREGKATGAAEPAERKSLAPRGS
jgi:hypothetical protein